MRSLVADMGLCYDERIRIMHTTSLFLRVDMPINHAMEARDQNRLKLITGKYFREDSVPSTSFKKLSSFKNFTSGHGKSIAPWLPKKVGYPYILFHTLLAVRAYTNILEINGNLQTHFREKPDLSIYVKSPTKKRTMP